MSEIYVLTREATSSTWQECPSAEEKATQSKKMTPKSFLSLTW
jgi:hypothetical protein